MGVVYGDIGTSPLYAIRECFDGASAFAIDRPNILGVLSLISWSLIVIVSLKYLLLVLRADNQGEGGILALAHLVVPARVEEWTAKHKALMFIGLFGAALLFGDGIITPALSVLSAVEGLRVATPSLGPMVVPLSAMILTALFAMQRFGTARVGQLFGPVTLLWFITLGGLGMRQIVAFPEILHGLNPWHGMSFFLKHGLHGTAILGAVFLAVTGAEALYADLGHFGHGPIRRSWFTIAFPALLLNYFGQGALLIRHPEMVDGIFYHLAPAWGLYPLVLLAMLATIIASQAVISGVFSLTSQAVQLDYFPRTEIRHTSASQYGQIYVPTANLFLFIGTLGLVLIFRSSGALAHAYGIAVSLTMGITTVLMYFVMTGLWEWRRAVAIPITAALLAIDLAFFSAIVPKIAHGGWIPLVIAVGIVSLMLVWSKGRQIVRQNHPKLPVRADYGNGVGALVFLVRDPAQVAEPIKDRKTFLVHVEQCRLPFMKDGHGRVETQSDRVLIHARYGFMETPDIPRLLAALDAEHGLGLDPESATYVLIRESLPPGNAHGMPSWAKGVFQALNDVSVRVSTLYGIPPGQVVEVNPLIQL